MVVDSTAMMNKFLMGISDQLSNECRSTMLIPNMDIYRLMVYAEHIEEQKLKQVGRDLKKVITKEGNSKSMFEEQDKPTFHKRFSYQISPNSPSFNNIKECTTKTNGGKGGRCDVDKTLCAKCDKRHEGKFLVGMRNSYGCCKIGYMKIDFSMVKDQGRENH